MIVSYKVKFFTERRSSRESSKANTRIQHSPGGTIMSSGQTPDATNKDHKTTRLLFPRQWIFLGQLCSTAAHSGRGPGTYDSDRRGSGGGGWGWTQLKSQSPLDGLYLSINKAAARTFNCIAGFHPLHPPANLFATDHSPQIGCVSTDWILQEEMVAPPPPFFNPPVRGT